MKKIIGLLLFPALCIAMENTELLTANNVEYLAKVIKGVLVIHPHEDITYSPYVQKDIKKALGLEMNESEPLVSVRALEGDGSSRHKLYLPEFNEFPDVLPLSLLRDKKDGDELTFTAGDKTKIILTCNQKIHIQSAVFENQLAYLVKKFKKHPRWHAFDKKTLIEKGIIVKVAKGEYQHGPNGYKFNE